MQIKKYACIASLVLIVIGCIAAAGCTATTTDSQQTADTQQNIPTATSTDAVWTAIEYDDGTEVKHIMTFHTDGTGEKIKDKGYKISDVRTFTWTQPDNCHFICTFADGDVDTFTLTNDGRLTHDGKYYQSTQKGTLPVVSTPVANPQDHPELIGTWETHELDKQGIETKKLEFKADGTGIKSKIKAKGTEETTPFTWVPVGSYYLIKYSSVYEEDEDDDTMQIINGVLNHDGEEFTKI